MERRQTYRYPQMSNHTSGETKAEIYTRRIIEHNKMILTEHYHFDYDKVLKEHIRDLGQYFRKITAAFSDKEMEDAMIIGQSILNITPEVRNIVKESRIKEGLCLVNAMHITASVFINDNESGLHKDFDVWVEGSRA
jgi:hypothetical protein